jgi:hypothetical protein
MRLKLFDTDASLVFGVQATLTGNQRKPHLVYNLRIKLKRALAELTVDANITHQSSLGRFF